MPITEILLEKKLNTLKKLKGKKQMVEEFKKVIEKYLEAVRALEEFEKRWGIPEDLMEEITSIEDALGIKSIKSSFLDKLTGRYYLRLALEIELLASKLNEPVLSIPEIITKFREKMNLIVDKRDILKALKILEKRNLVKIKRINDEEYIVFTHVLDNQIKKVMELFSKYEYLTPADLVKELGWSLAKAIVVLERIHELGLCTKEEFPLRYYPIRFK